MNTYDIITISGDTFELNMIYKDSSGSPIDLTDYELYFQTRENQKSPDVTFDKSFTISAEDGVEGIIRFNLTADETELLTICDTSSKYVYAMRLTNTDATDVKTLLSGTLEVVKGVI